MFSAIRNIKEEILFYERQNNRFSVDDLLRLLHNEKPKHLRTIRENEKRIEGLEGCILELM